MITWWPNYILSTSKFSYHICCHDNHTKWDFHENLWQKHIYPSFCKVVLLYHRQFELMSFPCFYWYVLCWQLFTRKSWKSTRNLHSVSISKGILVFGCLFLIIMKINSFIISFLYFEIQVTIYTFSNDRNCKKNHNSSEKNMDDKKILDF